ncbi:MAG TPA: tripartite tricarboxylate transporter substrate-binding protein [Oligoflexus sp.]|uniref:tripartite tricarboxylate transporter substrate-binding protein n=1 Tax=Oligoflexus sp. TaxID=1971216 RepID=UPI002D2EEB73|nr:tripartite tricarboxylate transporter substrate-binding protein [Oligoflexus sp.]HYX34259.1 tripartite tricarboxylate transporter substrate-binding protein [Oligoflexus sp.]
MISKLRQTLFMVSLLGNALLANTGRAADAAFPTKPVTMIVPFAAGGPTDTVARLIAQAMSVELKQTVVIENVGGAGGTLGAGRVARAAADGYTILLHHIGQATSPTLYRNKLPYKVEDFEAIGLVTAVPMTIVARKDFPPKDLKELIDYAKKNKDKVTYANAGLGSASHLCGMLLMKAMDTVLTTVPYKGTGPAMNDLLGGQVDFMCDQTTNTTSQIKAGKIKGYAVTSKKAIASLPQLPTAADSGLPGFEISVWHALYAPKSTPPAAVNRLNQALKVALKDKIVISRFAELGTEPEPEERVKPEVLKAYLKDELTRWDGVIKKAGQFAD